MLGHLDTFNTNPFILLKTGTNYWLSHCKNSTHCRTRPRTAPAQTLPAVPVTTSSTGPTAVTTTAPVGSTAPVTTTVPSTAYQALNPGCSEFWSNFQSHSKTFQQWQLTSKWRVYFVVLHSLSFTDVQLDYVFWLQFFDSCTCSTLILM
jgi:hypothetical protein